MKIKYLPKEFERKGVRYKQLVKETHDLTDEVGGNANSHKKFESVYDLFVHNVFFNSYAKFREWKYNLFETVDCKKFLEDYFKIRL